MTCEEFEAMGLDAEGDASLSEAEHAAAAEHAACCSRCAALQNSWQAARVELRSLAEESVAAQAPPRVELRLRQEFRTQHHNVKARRTAVIAAWALAAGAVLVGAVSWINWRTGQQKEAARHVQAPETAPALPPNNMNAGANGATPVLDTGKAREQHPAENTESAILLAENDANGFTLLPGVLPAETDEAAILRVRLQRGALGALGLPVNEERAGEWIQVDLLVGNDGLPQAVRLPK